MEERSTGGSQLTREPTTPASSIPVTNTTGDYKEPPSKCLLELAILSWVILIMAVVGIARNGIVVWILGFRLRRKAVSIYILNLATADCMVLFFYIIVILKERIISFYVNGFVMKFLHTMLLCPYITGLSMLSAISTERCVSVLWPIWYRCHRPTHTSSIICGLLWALILLLSFLNIYYCNWCLPLSVSIAAYLIVLFLILSGFNLVLLVRMCCGSHRIPLTRLYVTVLLTVLVFLFCGLPFGIYHFLLYPFDIGFPGLPCYYRIFLIFLSSFNSSVNPIIYYFVGSFRQRKHQSLKLVLQRALQDSPETGDPGSRFPQETLMTSVSRVDPC